MMADLKHMLNLFLLTYPSQGKQVVDIYNDFITATNAQVPLAYLPDFLSFINDVKDLDIGLIVAAAESDRLIPYITGQIIES